uniref:Uncharacterized protein n=1 Tax=Ditylenchus dipsaci TaxID=166011 RepID=A0A915DMN7_9BILA
MVWIMSEYVQYDDEGHDFVEYICDVFNEVDIDVGAGKSRRKSVPKISSEGYTELEENKFMEVARRLIQKYNSHNKVHSYYDGDDTDSTETDKTPTSTCWSCQDFSYKTFIYNLKYYNVDYKPYLWMTCNEFGWFQSTNIGYNLFESSVPVNFYVDMCADVFGKDLFNRATIDAKVKATNDFYGGNENYNGTNVFFVNGSEDPWHPLSAYHFHNKNNNVNVTSILIEGTSMCEDMYRGNHYDTPELKAARKKIRAQLKSWLQ